MLTEFQRLQRRDFCGASDVPAILGMSPFVTPWDVWNSKVNGDDRPAGKAASLGNYLEAAVLNMAESEEHGWGLGFTRDICSLELAPARHGVFIANFDGINVAKGLIFEAKTTGITSEVDAGYGRAGRWRPDKPNVPHHVAVQCQIQMYVAGVRFQSVYLGCLRGGKGFGRYEIPRNGELISRVVPRVLSWWERHIVGREEPGGQSARRAVQTEVLTESIEVAA